MGQNSGLNQMYMLKIGTLVIVLNCMLFIEINMGFVYTGDLIYIAWQSW